MKFANLALQVVVFLAFLVIPYARNYSNPIGFNRNVCSNGIFLLSSYTTHMDTTRLPCTQ